MLYLVYTSDIDGNKFRHLVEAATPEGAEWAINSEFSSDKLVLQSDKDKFKAKKIDSVKERTMQEPRVLETIPWNLATPKDK